MISLDISGATATLNWFVWSKVSLSVLYERDELKEPSSYTHSQCDTELSSHSEQQCTTEVMYRDDGGKEKKGEKKRYAAFVLISWRRGDLK